MPDKYQRTTKYGPEALFFAEDHPIGRRQAIFLHNCRIICPWWADATPTYRTTWETIQQLNATHQDRIAARLRACEINSEAGDQYAALRGESPLQVFAQGFAHGILPNIVEGYRPENGFDLDVFLHADDASRPRFVIEIFPRFRAGQPATAYTSVIHYDAPLLEKVGANQVEATHYLITRERLNMGDRPDDILHDWANWHDLWRVQTEEMIDLLLDKAAFSIIESASDEVRQMVEPSVTEDQPGRGLKAHLRFTTSK